MHYPANSLEPRNLNEHLSIQSAKLLCEPKRASEVSAVERSRPSCLATDRPGVIRTTTITMPHMTETVLFFAKLKAINANRSCRPARLYMGKASTSCTQRSPQSRFPKCSRRTTRAFGRASCSRCDLTSSCCDKLLTLDFECLWKFGARNVILWLANQTQDGMINWIPVSITSHRLPCEAERGKVTVCVQVRKLDNSSR
jgi:hypothetical protein